MLSKKLAIMVMFLVFLSTFSMVAHSYVLYDDPQSFRNQQFYLKPLIVSPMFDGHPYIMQDSANKIWVFFVSNRSEDGHRHIFYVTSVDGGLTWSEASLFQPAFTTGVDVYYTPVAFQDSTSGIWVAWLKHTGPNADQIWFARARGGIK